MRPDSSWSSSGPAGAARQRSGRLFLGAWPVHAESEVEEDWDHDDAIDQKPGAHKRIQTCGDVERLIARIKDKPAPWCARSALIFLAYPLWYKHPTYPDGGPW